MPHLVNLVLGFGTRTYKKDGFGLTRYIDDGEESSNNVVDLTMV